jgi:predicted nuclease of restriction endonuclease-like (RecB) superfamily
MAKKRAKKEALPAVRPRSETAPAKLLHELRDLIQSTRSGVAQAVNSALVLLYWQVGNRIRTETLKSERAAYGEQIVVTLSRQLAAEFGQGFAEKNLRRMIQLAELFPDHEIVVTLSRQLGWSHFLAILPLKDALRRDFYAEMCRMERWSVRTLRAKIGGMLFERTALSKKPEILIKRELANLRREDTLSPDLVFRDPYFLNFLGLKDAYSEKDLETAILREMEQFILELGAGFSFVARQMRIVIDGEDFYLDLLFYHRKLRRLVAVDLKLERFKAADKGQMELYLLFRERNNRYYTEFLIMPSALRGIPPHRITQAELFCSSP